MVLADYSKTPAEVAHIKPLLPSQSVAEPQSADPNKHRRASQTVAAFPEISCLHCQKKSWRSSMTMPTCERLWKLCYRHSDMARKPSIGGSLPHCRGDQPGALPRHRHSARRHFRRRIGASIGGGWLQVSNHLHNGIRRRIDQEQSCGRRRHCALDQAVPVKCVVWRRSSRRLDRRPPARTG